MQRRPGSLPTGVGIRGNYSAGVSGGAGSGGAASGGAASVLASFFIAQQHLLKKRLMSASRAAAMITTIFAQPAGHQNRAITTIAIASAKRQKQGFMKNSPSRRLVDSLSVVGRFYRRRCLVLKGNRRSGSLRCRLQVRIVFVNTKEAGLVYHMQACWLNPKGGGIR